LYNICPLIIKNNENGQAECKESQSRTNGTVNPIVWICPDPKIVWYNKMFCTSTGQEFDINCDVLPDNETSITLKDAEELCLDLEDVPEYEYEYDEATTTKEDVVIVDSTTEQDVNIPKGLRELNLNC
jgi:hypothetical protein